MDNKPGSLSRPAGCHRLPQIPTMGRHVRTAQSKSSARQSLESKMNAAEFLPSVAVVDNLKAIVNVSATGDSKTIEPTLGSEYVGVDNNATVKSAVGKKREAGSVLVNRNSELDIDKQVTGGEPDTLTSPSQVREKRKRKSLKEAAVEINQTVTDTVNEPKKRGRKRKDRLSGVTADDNILADHGVVEKSKRKSKDDSTQIKNNLEVDESLSPHQTRKIQSPLEKKKSLSKLEQLDNTTKEANSNSKKIVLKKSESKLKLKSVEPVTEMDIELKSHESQGNGEGVESGFHIPRCVIITPGELLSEEQQEKILEAHSVGLDLEHPVKWSEGVMLWGKVSGHPYWPCMISPYPFTKLITRIRAAGKPSRTYHVQFFGSGCERGWICEVSLMEYKGKEAFMELVRLDSLKPKTQKKGKSTYNPFKVNPSRQLEWNEALEEAEDAFLLNVTDRKEQYSFDYLYQDKTDKKKKIAAPTTPSAPAERKRKKSSSMSPDESRKSKKRKIDRSSSCEENELEGFLDVYDFTQPRESPQGYNTATINSPVSGKRSKKPTMKLVESILQSSPGAIKRGANANNTPVIKTSSMSPAKNQVVTSGKKRGRPRKDFDPAAAVSVNVKAEQKTVVGEALMSEVAVTPCTATALDQDSNSCTDQTTPNQGGKRQSSRKSSQMVKESVTSPVTTVVKEENPSPKYVLAAVALSSRTISQDSDTSSTDSKPRKIKESEPYELEILKLQATTKMEKEHICCKCENNGDLIECHGSCSQYYHLKCLRSPPQSCDEFKCEECLSGNHPCFLCKTTGASTRKCSVHQCGKFYHEECVQNLRLTRMVGDKGFICPLHACTTCAVDNIKNIKATKGRLFRCIRCPKAYHQGDFCIAAGSQVLGGGYIVCSDHFQPNKSQSSHAHVNITWCFLCNRGGALLCCESCPASYHPDCVKVDKTPDEAWFCEECNAGRKPLYGNIVWIKVGNYRWWPGEVCHPRHVPMNIQEKSHQVGEFPVRFFGSHDYYWIHKGRVFLFEEGDKASRDRSSKSLYKVYTRGVEEATVAFIQWKAVLERKEEQEQERSDKKPSTFKFIKRNFPIGNVQINLAELSEIPRCECKPDQEDPCSSDCLNRILMYECHPQVCPAKDACNNQRFQKRQYAECEPFKAEGRGWGLRAVQDLKKGQFVMEYVGDLIDEEECKNRIEVAHENNITNFYMLTMDKNRTIDAGPRGNNSRFMNHSCCPNLVTQKWMVNGDIRVGLFTLCDITKGTEVTFNYNLECLGNEKTACSCGADNCSGFLGVRPKTAVAIANEKKMKEMKKKKKKKKLDVKKETEDACFRCGWGGELVMCDKGNCPKVYHLQCLKLTKPPTGKWSCPWHHCDECGKPATTLCSECPNSFCQAHIEGNITTINGFLFCCDHEEFEELTNGSTVCNIGTQATDFSTENSEDEREESVIGRVSLDSKAKKNECGGKANGKKVAKRKSFKDILSEAPPVSAVNVNISSGQLKEKIVQNFSGSVDKSLDAQKEKKLKRNVIPNAGNLVNGRPDLPNGHHEEKIGIFLKKTGSTKAGGTKTRYKSQLLSSPNKLNSLSSHGALKGDQDDSEDSMSELVMDIP